MYRVLAVLFYIIFVVDINEGSLQSSTSIDEDATELTQLATKFSSLMPDILKKLKPFAYCQVIDKCCGDEDRSEAISLLGDRTYHNAKSRFTEVVDACMKSSTSENAQQFCSSFDQSIISIRAAYTNPDVNKFRSITRKYQREFHTTLHQVVSICNGEQIHAILCSTSDELIKECFNTILQKIYNDNGNEYYQKNIMDIKQAFMDINQQLS